jgi:phosphatidylglycerophosphate synthase
MIEQSGRKIPAAYENPFDNLVIDTAEWLNALLYPLGVTPNMMTTVSLILGICSAYLLHQRIYVFAGALFMLAYLLDCMDGNFARKYDMVTNFGDWYDHVSDVLKISLTVFVVCLSKYPATKEKVLFVVVTIVLFITSQVQLGCQERIYTSMQSDTLGFMKTLCCVDEPTDMIVYTRWLGCGTLILFITLFIFYLSFRYPK